MTKPNEHMRLGKPRSNWSSPTIRGYLVTYCGDLPTPEPAACKVSPQKGSVRIKY